MIGLPRFFDLPIGVAIFSNARLSISFGHFHRLTSPGDYELADDPMAVRPFEQDGGIQDVGIVSDVGVNNLP
jgi:hypothetical protein